MYQSDWILRQIELLGEFLRSMLSALREHRPDEVVALAEEAIAEVGQLDAGVLDSLTPDGLAVYLGAGADIEPIRARFMGEILLARADAREMQGDQEAARLDRARAFAVLSRAGDDGDAAELARIASLVEVAESSLRG